ncbi:MAG: type II secretion system F family protein [Actinomycetota bacterium]|nr:type II secretion system F family protein [Actinomycetota bacterium]
MRRLVVIAAASATVAALVVPGFALGQAKAPKLTVSPSSGFPDRGYLLQLPERRALTAADVSVTENDGPVSGLAVVPPGGAATGAILLIDASNSMQGAPLQGAMQAARAFMNERKANMPLSVVVFGPDDTTLAEFTTDAQELAASVVDTPTTSEGTHIYDALIEATESVTSQGLRRATIVLMSDGTDIGSEASLAEAQQALAATNTRVYSVGLRSPQYAPDALQAVSRRSGGRYAEAARPAELAAIFSEIGADLATEYEVTYRSVLPPQVDANVRVVVNGLPAARSSYRTPVLAITSGGTFDRSWIDDVIVSPYLAVFIVVSVIALLALALFAGVDARNRSLRHRMSQYVNVPTEEEGRVRRAEVTAMLADRAQRRVEGHRWFKSFERDVELGGFKYTPLGIIGWTLVAAIITSLVVAVAFQSLAGLFAGLFVPVVTRFVVKRRVTKKRKAFREQLPDNLDVMAGALRAGHSLVGAMNVMVEGAEEPFKSEFRRVLQDEQLGVPIDDALMVMSRRMDNLDVEQVSIVTRLQREAGGNTAEVLDRVVDNIRGRMELQRLVQVLTAQGRIARWILTAIPVFLLGFFLLVNRPWLEPLWETTLGNIAMVMWVIMLVGGWFAIKKIVEIEV